MSKRAVGFRTILMWLLATYFFAASRVLDPRASSEAERALVTGLGIMAGAFALTAFALSCAYLALREEARLRDLAAREQSAHGAAATD